MLKQMVIIAFLIFLSPVLAHAINYCEDANTQGCWIFTEGRGTTVADDSQNSNTGNFASSGNPVWATMDGTNSPSYSEYEIDYSSDFISMGDVTFINAISELSATVWVDLDDDTADHIVLEKSTISFATGFTLFFDNVGPNRNNVWDIFWDDGDASFFRVEVATNSALASGGWYHLAFTWKQNDNLRLFINGVEDANSPTATTNVDFPDSTAPLQMGQHSNGADRRYMDGQTGEVGMFDLILDSTDINDIMDNGLVQVAAAVGTTLHGATIN